MLGSGWPDLATLGDGYRQSSRAASSFDLSPRPLDARAVASPAGADRRLDWHGSGAQPSRYRNAEGEAGAAPDQERDVDRGSIDSTGQRDSGQPRADGGAE